MNVNVWNIKDMFSIPPGASTNRTSARNTSSSDYSSLTDSQFLFSSQFCPDISQPASQEFNMHSKDQNISQVNSQDSGPSFLQKYQSKPYLYNNDRGSLQPFNSGKAKGLLDEFEESKKKAKEKFDNEQLKSLISKIQVNIEEIQEVNDRAGAQMPLQQEACLSVLDQLKMTVCQVEENSNLKSKSILDSVEAASNALQDKVASHHESILNALPAKSNVEQVLLDLNRQINTKDEELTDLKSKVQLLLTCMDVLKSQQGEQHVELSEKITKLSDYMKSLENKILVELQKINVVPELALTLKDNTTQTSPNTLQDIADNIKSQVKTMNMCADDSPVSQANVLSIPDRTGHGFSSELTGSLCVKELVGTLKACNIACLNCVKIPSNCFESKIFQICPEQSNPISFIQSQRTSFEEPSTLVKVPVKSAHTLNCSNLQQNDKPTDPSEDNEYQPHNVSERNTKHLKRKKATKHKKYGKKKRTHFPLKNNTDTVSTTKSSQDNTEKTSLEWDNSATCSQNDFFPNSERCAPSLPVILAPVRKVQQRNALLSSKKGREQPLCTKEDIYEGERVGLCAQKCVRWDFSSEESHNLHYSMERENLMYWDSPVTPLSNNSSNDSILQAEQKSCLSLFFDSSDDSG